MRRPLALAALLLATVLALLVWRGGMGFSSERGSADLAPAPPGGRAAEPKRSAEDRSALHERIERLEAQLADETVRRRDLAGRLDEALVRLAALEIRSRAAADPAAHGKDAAADGTVTEPGAVGIEQALSAAGVDPETVEAIRRHSDALALSALYLRDEAAREGSLDSPRFAEDMAAIEAERASIRDDIGDEAYDRYLFALGRANRVRVNGVMSGSAAAEAGVRSGDTILRYGDKRILGPTDLIAETHGGTAGEIVRLEVLRNGERLEVLVPRGPLGLRLAAVREDPEAS